MAGRGAPPSFSFPAPPRPAPRAGGSERGRGNDSGEGKPARSRGRGSLWGEGPRGGERGLRWRVEEAAMGGQVASGRRRIGRDQVGAGISPLERSGGAGWILRLPLSGGAARGWEGNAGDAGEGGRRESSKLKRKAPLCVCVFVYVCVPIPRPPLLPTPEILAPSPQSFRRPRRESFGPYAKCLSPG